MIKVKGEQLSLYLRNDNNFGRHGNRHKPTESSFSREKKNQQMAL